MSLTKTDLKAIEVIVETTVVKTVKPMIDDLATSTAAGFNEMDRRFAIVDERFEQVDKRFDQVDERFDRVEKRLGALEHETSRISGNISGLRQRVDRHDRRLLRLEPKRYSQKG